MARYRLNATIYVLKWQKKHQKVPKFNKKPYPHYPTPPPLCLSTFLKKKNQIEIGFFLCDKNPCGGCGGGENKKSIGATICIS